MFVPNCIEIYQVVVEIFRSLPNPGLFLNFIIKSSSMS